MIAADRHWHLDGLLQPWIGEGVPATPISGINLDSRLIAPGDVYLAVAGASTHGMHFALSAVQAGAVAVVADSEACEQFQSVFTELESRGVPVSCVDQLQQHTRDMASRFFDAPDKSLNLIAVTGTDGKTTVCRFISQALTSQEQPCGYIGTLGWGLGDVLKPTALTTPDSVSLLRMLATLRDQGAQHVALEASSHGIAEGRLDGLSLDIAVLTNLGRDHLDYHVTIEAYRVAKERLFHWPSLQAIVLNTDDVMGQDLAAQITSVPCFSYSANGQPNANTSTHVRAQQVVPGDSGLAFQLLEDAFSRSISTSLLGRFNVDNLLACYASLRACGVAANDACHAVSQANPVAGRMERLGGGDKVTVVIDYSHTPGALEVAIAAVRVHCKQELWIVFGCGGDRDTGKRAPMASAAQQADHVVLTDDNPRTECSNAIISDVMRGFDHPDKVNVIPDRGEAIAHALRTAKPGDLVLIAGKGHENYQIVGTQRHHFSDREQAQAALGLTS